MGKYDAEMAKLGDWKNASTKLFLHSAGAGLLVWCVGRLMHVASSALHFGVDGIDGSDLFLDFNIHNAHLSFLNKVDERQFNTPISVRRNYGLGVQILLLPGAKGAKVVLAELLGEVIESS